jgi:hypothetical protein
LSKEGSSEWGKVYGIKELEMYHQIVYGTGSIPECKVSIRK